jgi:hypothetical protein
MPRRPKNMKPAVVPKKAELAAKISKVSDPDSAPTHDLKDRIAEGVMLVASGSLGDKGVAPNDYLPRGAWYPFTTPGLSMLMLEISQPTLAHLCAAHGGIELLEKCLAAGVPVGVKDSDGNTPLHIAAMCNQLKVVSFLLQPHLKCAINAQNNSGFTPLYHACAAKNGEVVARLLEAGVNPSIPDRIRGSQAIHVAATVGCTSIVLQLLEAGVLATATDTFGRMPRFLTQDRETSILLLAQYVNERATGSGELVCNHLWAAVRGSYLKEIDICVEAGAVVNTPLGAPPLHELIKAKGAAPASFIVCAKRLLAAGADPHFVVDEKSSLDQVIPLPTASYLLPVLLAAGVRFY